MERPAADAGRDAGSRPNGNEDGVSQVRSDGSILFKGRFEFLDYVGEGSFGAIRNVKDIKKPYKSLIVKI